MTPYSLPAPVSLPPVPWVASPPPGPRARPAGRPLSGCTCADWEGEE